MVRLPIALVAAVLVSSGPAADAPAGTPPELGWYDREGNVVWTAALPRDHPGEPVPLSTRPWYPALPEMELARIEGGSSSTTDFAGSVLLLDFWASWCDPCVETLPWLQSFYERERERGLVVLAVNMQEPDRTARQFFWALNLSLPIVRYTDGMHEALGVEALPTVIVADRQGRVRARFNGYKRGAEEQISKVVAGLLDEREDSGEPLAEVLDGAGGLEVRWSRPIPETVRGLAVVAGTEGPTVFAATGWEVFCIGAEGDARLRKRVGPGVERLRVGRLAEGPAVYGYRPVGQHVVRVPLADGEPRRFEAPSHVLDLQVEPADGERPAGLLLGTVDGLLRLDLDGEIVDRREDTGAIWQVAAGPGGREWVALGEEGKLLWLDGSLATRRQADAAGSPRRLITHPATGAVGLATAAVTAAVTGSFLEGEGAQVALALEGRLVLLDTASGRLRFLARWPEIEALAAGDLDGDGRTELLVGSGKRITALAGPGATVVVAP